MKILESQLEQYLEARLRSGASRLGNPELLSIILDLAKGTGARTVLDVGSGCGDLVARFWKEGIPATGLELCPSLIERARSKVPPEAPLIQGDAHKLTFPDGAFELVTCVLVLHYLEHPKTALFEACRVLKSGVWIILADRVASADPALRAVQERIERLRNPAVQRILTPRELEADLEQAGFTVVQRRSYEDTVALESWLSGTPPDRANLIREELSRLAAPDLGGLLFEHHGAARLRIKIYVARKK